MRTLIAALMGISMIALASCSKGAGTQPPITPFMTPMNYEGTVDVIPGKEAKFEEYLEHNGCVFLCDAERNSKNAFIRVTSKVTSQSWINSPPNVWTDPYGMYYWNTGSNQIGQYEVELTGYNVRVKDCWIFTCTSETYAPTSFYANYQSISTETTSGFGFVGIGTYRNPWFHPNVKIIARTQPLGSHVLNVEVEYDGEIIIKGQIRRTL